jgi:hypothetical protein
LTKLAPIKYIYEVSKVSGICGWPTISLDLNLRTRVFAGDLQALSFPWFGSLKRTKSRSENEKVEDYNMRRAGCGMNEK